MTATIKSASLVDINKTTMISYCDSKRSIPVKLVGIAPQEFSNNVTLLVHVHGRVASIIKAFENEHKDKLTSLTLEMAI